MGTQEKANLLTTNQQRTLKLLFKFRFVSVPLLASVMNINPKNAYNRLVCLTNQNLVIKVYGDSYRIERKPAYYYLSKAGVTTVRKLLGITEAAIHPLYKNESASEAFIEHCLILVGLYVALSDSLPKETEIFTKTEINQFTQFPATRPDLYVRTPNGREAVIILADALTPFYLRRQLDELIAHSEEGGWKGSYPYICFVLKNEGAKQRFLLDAQKTLTHLGYDEHELTVLGASVEELRRHPHTAWSLPHVPKQGSGLFRAV